MSSEGPDETGSEQRRRVYIDTNDWWIGVYRGPDHWYVCPLPCIVLRLRRSKP